MRLAIVGVLVFVAGCGSTAEEVEQGPEADSAADALVEEVDSARVDSEAADTASIDSEAADTASLDSALDSGTPPDTALPAEDTSPSDVGVGTTPGWYPLATITGLSGRSEHTAVWNDGLGEMIVWGGTGCTGGATAFCGDGARWDKKTNSWTMLPASPIVARRSHTAVWTGTKMVVWGGYGGGPPSAQLGDGAAYDPVANTWTTLAAGPSAREGHTAVWTGSEMLVWGGEGPTGTGRSDGMRWNPATGAWSAMKASPLSGRKATDAVWTGTKMIVFGGEGNACPAKLSSTDVWGYCGDGAAYDPSTDTWTMLPSAPIDARAYANAVAAGPLAIFLHGHGLASATVIGDDDGASYDPVANTWTKIASAGTIMPPAKRYSGFVWYGAGKLYGWGGLNITGATFTYPRNGASYDPTTAKWTAMPAGGLGGVTGGRYSGTVVWTGSEAVLWGGRQGPTSFHDGMIFRP